MDSGLCTTTIGIHFRVVQRPASHRDKLGGGGITLICERYSVEPPPCWRKLTSWMLVATSVIRRTNL